MFSKNVRQRLRNDIRKNHGQRPSIATLDVVMIVMMNVERDDERHDERQQLYCFILYTYIISIVYI